MRTNLMLRRIHLLVLTLGCLVFAPRVGAAFVSQSNAAQQEPAPSTPPASSPPAAQAPANQPAPVPPTVPAPGKKTSATPKEQAWQILEDASASDKNVDRATAILVLGLIPNDARSARIAQKALTDDRPEVRAAAAAALGNMQSRASIPKLKAAMDDQDPSVALAAAHSLDLMHDNSAYEVYYEILNGDRKAGRGLIASQSSMLHDPKKMAEFGFEQGIGFVPFAGIGWGAIKAIRKDDSSPVRAAAARVLARDPDPATTKALIEATGDNSWIVQVAAIEALAKRGDPSTLSTVERYLSDDKSAIKFTAAAAVIHLSAVKQAGARKQRRTPDRKRP
jgi:HEAT repeat protein